MHGTASPGAEGPEPAGQVSAFCALGGVAFLGLLALLLGGLGVWNNERGLATNFGPSLIGAALGALALFIVLLMFAVTH